MAFTYFFRDLHTLELIVKHVIPSVSGFSKVRVWDAGCAMGPEPYSLAIMFAENMGRFAFRNLRVDATDLDGSNLFGKIIGDGIYSVEELKRIPKELFARYFQSVAREASYKIDETIRSKVFYRKHDLLSLEPAGSGYNLILCKNVLLHFQPAERVEVIRMFHGALAPGGYFATEQTQKMPAETACLFEQVAADAQLFRKIELKH